MTLTDATPSSGAWSTRSATCFGELATGRKAELIARLSAAKDHRDRAQAMLDQFDRPVVRRLHRLELMRASGDLNQAQGIIRESVAELTEVEGRLPAIETSLAEAKATLRDRHSLERARHGIRRELDRDLASRASSIADDLPDHMLDRLGPRPEHGAARDLWDEAAARLDQHAAAFDVSHDYRYLGQSWRWEATAIAVNGRAVSQACERVDRSVGRAPAIEAPGLGLGL